MHWPVLDIFQQAANEFGIPTTSDFNDGTNYGVGYFDVTQKSGWRLNSKQAFLSCPPQNLDIVTDAQVEKVLVDHDDNGNVRCSGVRFVKGKEKIVQEVMINRRGITTGEVILTAGAIGSVQILERSGIGCRKRLENLGVSVLKDLPGVGENLQDHLQIRVVSTF